MLFLYFSFNINVMNIDSVNILAYYDLSIILTRYTVSLQMLHILFPECLLCSFDSALVIVLLQKLVLKYVGVQLERYLNLDTSLSSLQYKNQTRNSHM